MRVVRILRLSLIVFTAAASCDRPLAIRQLEPRLLTTDVWAGGEIQVRLAAIPAPGNWLEIGGDSAAITLIDDSTISAAAPQTDGLLEIRLHGPGGTEFLEALLHVHGFRDARPGPPAFGYPLPLSAGLPIPAVYVNGESSLVRLDLRTGTSIAYPGSIHDPWCARGPGPTPAEDILILGRRNPSNGSCVFALWRMTSAPQKIIDSVPGGMRINAQLSANNWLVTTAHLACLVSIAPASNVCRPHEEVNGIRFSPRRDRAFMYYGLSASGVPIFSTATGDSAYAFHEGRASAGASFSPDGDTILIAVSDGAAPLLIMARASDGQRFGSAPLAFGNGPEDVLVDPTAPYVYVLGWNRVLSSDSTQYTSAVAHILVLRRPSLAVVAELLAPASYSNVRTDSLCYWCDNRLVLDASNRELYVLGMQGRDGRATLSSSVARFGLLP